MKSAQSARKSAGRRVVLLGPQGHQQNLTEAVAELDVGGPLAVVTAGWKELEAEDSALAEHVGRETRNLGLYPRAESLFREDAEVRELLYERHDGLRALQTLHRLRLAPQLETCRQLFARTDPAAPDELHAPEIESAIAGVRALDAHHLGRTAALDADIAGRIAPRERPSLTRHRDELAGVLAGVGALLIAGGHVGVLLNRLRLFDVLELAPDVPLVAWSGGAMVLAERIVLFHDSPPQGPGDAEVYAPGLGLVRGVVPLPHAHHRLRLDDPARVALLAQRFAPDTCAALDGGERLTGFVGGAEWEVSDTTRVLRQDGAVRAERVA